MKWRIALFIPAVYEVGAILPHGSDADEVFRFRVRRYPSRWLIARQQRSTFRKVLTTQTDQLLLGREFAEDALIEGSGFVCLAEFPIALAQTEQGRGNDFALLIGLRDDGLVGFDRGIEVMVGFFLEKAVLEILSQR